MSMFGNLSRFGVTIRQAHARNKAIRALNDLPAHVQKDIGWPASPPSDPQAAPSRAASGHAALMTFADKCKLLGKRRGRDAVPAAGDNKLRAALLPKRP